MMTTTLEKRIKTLLKTFLFVFVFSMPSFALAQSSAVTIFSSPAQPKSFETFSVGLRSDSVDLDRAEIEWYINDIPALSGRGETGFSSQTRKVGELFNVEAVITTDGGSFTKSITVSPQDVDVLWSGHSYTPHLYKGKSMTPSAGIVFIEVEPDMLRSDGTRYDKEDLEYTWRQDGFILGNASGLGRSSILLENGQIRARPLVLQLTVATRDGSLQVDKRIEIPVSPAQVRFYERLPLTGINYATQIMTTSVVNDEITVVAEPYFFSLDDVLGQRLSYKWELGVRDIDTPEIPNELVLRKEPNTFGTLKAKVRVRNENLPLRVLQEARYEFNVIVEE